ncbi:undecaprenyl-diphosphate phosphatase [bacterium]|nr:undecaprenyl-diphosphate phosphatase [bacterium]
MALLYLILLAGVQGLTEFLPVSSSGHLVLLQHWTSAFDGDVFLDVVLHVGTLLAVLVVYRHEVKRLLTFDAAAVQYLVALAIGTLPAVLAGLLFEDEIEALFVNPRAAAVALVVTGLILFSTRRTRSDVLRLPGGWHPVAPPLHKALLIGCAQALAIVPGISRSGSTIAASLWLRLARDEAARFSFLLSGPAIAGALVLHLLRGETTSEAGTLSMLLGACVAFLVGLVAVRLTALMVVRRHFWKFALYCVPLGVVSYIVLG